MAQMYAPGVHANDGHTCTLQPGHAPCVRALGLGFTWTPKVCRTIALRTIALHGIWAIILPTFWGFRYGVQAKPDPKHQVWLTHLGVFENRGYLILGSL